jgi:hypothetical protein
MKKLIKQQLTHIGKDYMVKRDEVFWKWLTLLVVIVVISLIILYLPR